MTEDEWATSDDAVAMLRATRGRSGERSLRLLACACARSRSDGLVEPELWRAVEVAEAVADGQGGRAELRAVWHDIWDLLWGHVLSDPPALAAAQACVDDFAPTAAARAVAAVPAAGLVREVLGNPFCTPPPPVTGCSPEAAGLARVAYADRRYDLLPQLADLLAAGGCLDDRLLAHLRSPDPHVRGCWALDAVLGLGPGERPVTADKWATATRPYEMLEWWEHLRGATSARKRRLLAAACCRRRWPTLPAGPLREALDAAERYADGRVDPHDLARLCEPASALGLARGQVLGGMSRSHPDWEELRNDWAVACAVASAAGPDDAPFGNAMHHSAADGGSGRDTEDAGQADLVRDVLGDPLHPTAFAPCWRSPVAVALARGVHADCAYDRLPILADALEEAGCDDPTVLAHCRDPGLHVPGCWVVDLVLDLR